MTKADISPLVLLVDDYEDSRYIYVHALTAAGYRVEEAEDGQQGLDKAFHEIPDLVVMDLSLPVLDGWEAIRRLRQDERTRRIPIVALTGHADVDGDDNPGFDALLVKPCSPDTLTEQVRTLLADTKGPPAETP
ncbi:response regulator [Pendulispora albinea]|uniref:Response regulator n=1 Tax=Pendulispora albinea TaxID=2741071 RepID=A0ABZ2LZR2_9BACT